MPTDQPPEESAIRNPQSAIDDWTPTERISWFPVPAEEDLDPRVAALVQRQREVLGAPNNVVRVHSWRPELMLRWLELYDYINRGPSGLSRIDREMIGVVVSAENRCIL
jgi:alkylhydroperoxidase family enzyme